MTDATEVIVNTGSWWGSLIGVLGGVIIGGAMSQLFTVRNSKQARQDRQVEREAERRDKDAERIHAELLKKQDLEREAAVRFRQAWTKATFPLFSEQAPGTGDTNSITDACAELEIVGRKEVSDLAWKAHELWLSALDDLGSGDGDTASVGVKTRQQMVDVENAFDKAVKQPWAIDPLPRRQS
jgi:gas vesicle protein